MYLSETNIKHTNSVTRQQILNHFIETEVSISTFIILQKLTLGKNTCTILEFVKARNLCFDFQLKYKCCCEFYDISKYSTVWTDTIFRKVHPCPKPWQSSIDGKLRFPQAYSRRNKLLKFPILPLHLDHVNCSRFLPTCAVLGRRREGGRKSRGKLSVKKDAER